MIRIVKDLNAIPASLTNATTERHWEAVISAGSWQGSERYKEEDTKEALKALYKNKCAFCEKSMLDQWKTVEHFRPKALYPWLGFSWDNLISACEQCNNAKNDAFDLPLGQRRVQYNGERFTQIHGLSAGYDAQENPLLFNPENADPVLFFNSDGYLILASGQQLNYTIDTYKLNREELVLLRMQELNGLKKRFVLAYAQVSSRDDLSRFFKTLKTELETLCDEVLQQPPFSAWKKYILRNPKLFLHKTIVPDKLIDLAIQSIKSRTDYAPIFR